MPPHAASRLLPVSALLAKSDEEWLAGKTRLNMNQR